MLKFFKSSSIILFLVILGYSPVFYFNICEDPYGIFTTDFTETRIEPNNHFIKMRYILGNKDKFNSFIFGNSRANNINPKLFKNGKYYNMYYSLGVPAEYLNDIRLLLDKHVEIKNIIVCLDYSSYTTDGASRESDLSRMPYETNKLKLFKKYLIYGFQIPKEKFKNEFYNLKPSDIYVEMFETGQAKNNEVEKFIENNKLTHINDPKFNVAYYGYSNRINATIDEIAEIKKLCDAKKVNLKFVMNPIHKTTYLASDKVMYFEFLNKLATISDFYDFSGLNKITTNNYFYYETSHYRPIVGDAMLHYIQENKPIDSIPDFGTLVTKANIESRINTLMKQRKP